MLRKFVYTFIHSFYSSLSPFAPSVGEAVYSREPESFRGSLCDRANSVHTVGLLSQGKCTGGMIVNHYEYHAVHT